MISLCTESSKSVGVQIRMRRVQIRMTGVHIRMGSGQNRMTIPIGNLLVILWKPLQKQSLRLQFLIILRMPQNQMMNKIICLMMALLPALMDRKGRK